MMEILRALIGKEWQELRQDRTLLVSTLLPPVLLTILPLVVLYITRSMPDDDTTELGMALADPSLAGLGPAELGQAVVGKQFGLLFLLMPLIIPSIIASYSIVGEKSRRTLEPLLATPIASWQLLLGKALAALIPAVGLTWACALAFSIGVRLLANTPRVAAAILSPAWVATLVLCAPLLALIAIGIAVAVSSRVNDPRTAQQISSALVLPFLMIFFGQLVGVLVLDVPLALGAALVLAALAGLALWVAARLFQREAILTRWK
jgi:ABC-2 type transport system permease protein